MKVPSINQLGNIGYTGNFTGFIDDFVADGKISTNLGSIITDINMKMPFNSKPSYSGTINSSGFNIGRFLNIPALGMIALNGKVRGSGFSVNELNTNFEGRVSKLDLGDYTYQNISINGDFEKNIYRALVS